MPDYPTLDTVRKSVDVNEHVRLSNIKLRHKLKKKETSPLLLFYTSQSQ